MGNLDIQIRCIEQAFHRARARMDALEAPFSFPANCCPSCACGSEWNDLADKREKQAYELARLLVKRNNPAIGSALSDAEVAEYLFLGYGRHNADWIRWRLRTMGKKGQ